MRVQLEKIGENWRKERGSMAGSSRHKVSTGLIFDKAFLISGQVERGRSYLDSHRLPAIAY